MIKEKVLQTASNLMSDKSRGFAHGYNNEHGQRFEEVLAEIYNIRKQDGSLWMQDDNTAEIDFTQEMIESSDLPEWVKDCVGGLEVKLLAKGRHRSIKLGDAQVKANKLKKGFALCVGVYDEIPQNIVAIKFYKMKAESQDRKVIRLAKMVNDFVKCKANPIKGIGGTREFVRETTKQLVNSRFYFTDCSKTPSNARQVQMVFRSFVTA
tara:strand:- start:27 stop:653 length:627 start_codon:yes stop_codon:yes gene_type:complete